MKITCVPFIIIFLITHITTFSATIYVDANQTINPNDGTTWATAFSNLQDALAVAGSIDEIWVKEGTYYPDALSPGNQNLSLDIALKNILGGFPNSLPNPGLPDRNWVLYPTILSGDINVVGDNSDNSYHVIRPSLGSWIIPGGSPNNRVLLGHLDGFIIQDGDSTADGIERGGGLYLDANKNNTPWAENPIINVIYDLTIVNCTFQNNYSNWRGGAVAYHQAAGSIILGSFINCTFNSNSSNNGGGAVALITVDSGSSISTIFDACSYSSNSVSWAGGAILISGWNAGFCDASFINNCSFSNNSATFGGAIEMNGNGNPGATLIPSFDSATFSFNTANGGDGGAVSMVAGNGDATPLISNSSFDNNFSTFKGGAIMVNGGFDSRTNPVIDNCSFTSNSVDEEGGAIFLAAWDKQSGHPNFEPQILNSTFDLNEARRGGAIFNAGWNSSEHNLNNPMISDCNFESNQALQNGWGGEGGAIYINANNGYCNPTVRNGTFFFNDASSSGGAIFNDGYNGGTCVGNIDNCVFNGNNAFEWGGAISNLCNGTGAKASPLVEACLFDTNSTANTANGGGGAIYNWSETGGQSSPGILRNIFTANIAPAQGGAIYNQASPQGVIDSEISNNVFDSNQATSASSWGGAIQNFNSGGVVTPWISNNTFYNNIANTAGRTINISDANPLIFNNIIRGTPPPNNISVSGGVPNVAYNNIEGGYPGIGNIDVDPLFIDPVNGDFSLQSTSLSIGVGDNAQAPAGGDLLGNTRIVGSTVDQGALEYFTPVPLEIISFTGYASDNINILNWKTINEVNTEKHIVERSMSGLGNWMVIETLEAAGYSTNIISYSYEDKHPFVKSFYRINTLDRDGQYQLSDVIVLRKMIGDREMGLYPNPAHNFVYIEMENYENVRIDIYSIMGERIKTITSLQDNRIDISNLSRGVYYLKYKTDHGMSFSKKLFVE